MLWKLQKCGLEDLPHRSWVLREGRGPPDLNQILLSKWTDGGVQGNSRGPNKSSLKNCCIRFCCIRFCDMYGNSAKWDNIICYLLFPIQLAFEFLEPLFDHYILETIDKSEIHSWEPSRSKAPQSPERCYSIPRGIPRDFYTISSTFRWPLVYRSPLIS